MRGRRPPRGGVTLQARTSSGAAWAAAIADLTALEARALITPVLELTGTERPAALRAMAKVRRVVRLMLGGRGPE